MTGLTSFLISPFKTGLDIDVEPLQAPADSFSKLSNFHIRHGYLEKRSGISYFNSIAPDSSTVNISSITQATSGVVSTATPHGYSTGSKVFITSVLGMTEVNDRVFTVTNITDNSFSIDADTTGYTAYSSGGTVAEVDHNEQRIMGIVRHIDATGGRNTLVFSAIRSYIYNSGTEKFVKLDTDPILSSGVSDFIWHVNWQSTDKNNRLYFTNGKQGTPAASPTLDGIRYYDPVTDATATKPFNPTIRTNVTLVGGKLLFVLGQRLIVLNTYEYDTTSTKNFPQRARWCSKQNPDNWDDVTAGGGGYTDASTGDHIISARALQNQIIVFFTNSVWALVATSDPHRAFRWQKINNFRACDGKMATIGYDRYVIALGIRGITATDGVETKRIDDRITNFVNDVINTENFNKVFCERSYAENRALTLFSNISSLSNENNGALVFDEESSAFSTYDISLNCLGYANAAMDMALNDFIAPKYDWVLTDCKYEDLTSFFWVTVQEMLLGGDIYGNIYIIDLGGDDKGEDIEASFLTASWNPYDKEGKEARLSYIDILVDTDTKSKATINFYKDTDNTAYISRDMDFLPNLMAITNIVDISNVDPVVINAPSHGLTTGDTVYIYGVEGMEEINSGGEDTEYTVTVVDEDNITFSDINSSAFDEYTGGGALYGKRFFKTKAWKRIFAGGVGFEHRVEFVSKGKDQPIKIHGIRAWFKPVGRRQAN